MTTARTVTATVLSPEPLPAGEHLARVSVQDVSRADAPAATVAETTRALTGPSEAGVRFTVQLAIPEVDEFASYIVRVHIDSTGTGDVSPGDRITTRSYPVLTRGAPDDIVVEAVQI